MRRSLFLVAPLAVGAFLLACENDNNSSSGGAFGVPEGGSFEAGSSDVQAPDAAQPDAADAAPTAPVTVVVERGTGFAANVTVVFHDATGAVLETKKTGADGKATSSGAVPAMATVLLGGGTHKHILTWTKVSSGDELRARDLEGSTFVGKYLVNTVGPFDGANAYRAYVGTCQGFPNAVPNQLEVFMYQECLRTTNAALATAQAGPTLLAYSFKKGNAALPPDGGSASVALGAWAAPVGLDVKVVNKPANGQSQGVLQAVADGNIFENDTAALGGEITVDTASFQVAAGFADAYQAAVRYIPSATTGASRLVVGKRVAAPQTTITVDMATALPIIDTASVDGTSPKRPKVVWHALAPLTATKGGSVMLDWNDGRDETNGWTFIVPPEATSLTAPALPAEANDWAPLAQGDGGQNAVYQEPAILFLDATAIPSADVFRREAGRAIPVAADRYSRDVRVVLPANGDVRITAKIETQL